MKADLSQIKGSPINFAAAFNHPQLIEYFLACSDDVNHQDQEGNTPLMTAVVYNSFEAAVVLLQHGADCTMTDNKGLNMLHYLALCASAEMMGLFLSVAGDGAMAGINITRENNEGLTPLQTFNRRSGATPELRSMFGRILEVLLQTRAISTMELANNGPTVREEGHEDFFDAVDIQQSERS